MQNAGRMLRSGEIKAKEKGARIDMVAFVE